jgi:hypothetical protein
MAENRGSAVAGTEQARTTELVEQRERELELALDHRRKVREWWQGRRRGLHSKLVFEALDQKVGGCEQALRAARAVRGEAEGARR